ncbi:hypothetical protein [Flavobacterium sp.]|jgi:hypothetical protein|uniref:hypothetical protein n=1 Tax=Flavobacterium sp. TaxID=239 RepID=UPI0037BF7BF6
MNQKLIKLLCKRHSELGNLSPVSPTYEDYQERRDIGIALAEHLASTGKDTGNRHIFLTLSGEGNANVLNDEHLTTYVLRKVYHQSGAKAFASLFLALEDIGEICPAPHERAMGGCHE